MRRFTDESGWLRVVVCFSALLVHHGLRDALITALPTLASSTSPPVSFSCTSPTNSTVTTDLPSSTQVNETFSTAYEESVYTARNTNLTFSATYIGNITFKNRKQLEDTLRGRNTFTVTQTLPLSHSAVGTEQESSDTATTIHSSPSVAPSLAESQEPWEKDAPSGGSYQSRIKSFPLGIPSLKHPVEKTNIERDDNVPKRDNKSDSVGYVLPRPPLFMSRGGKDTSLPLESLKNRILTRQKERGLDSQRANIQRTKHTTVSEYHSAIYKLKREAPEPVKFRGRKVLATSSPPAQWHSTDDWASRQGRRGNQDQKVVDVNGRKVELVSLEGHQLKEEWSMVIEGMVLSAAYWGWFFSALFADPLIDRVGVPAVLSASVGVAGLLGLLTHTASLGGPWTLLGFRVVQGTVQGVSYPAVVRVLEGIPSNARAPAALLVFLGPSLGTGLGAGLGSLPQWYVATYVVGSLAVVLTPLCLLLPPPPDVAPHKEMLWKRVLSCRGVWACVSVHMANTWMLYTLLVGLPFCLTYTDLQQPSASGWVVVAAAVAVCAVVRLLLFLASKLTGKRPSTVLNRRRIPVVVGTVMVMAAVIVMATAGLDSMEVLVGVGVGLAGLGVGVARVGYRLNVDDMAPLGAWRVTKVLDAAAVVTAALSPLVVSALAQAGTSGWVGVWLVPLAALLPTAAIHLFLLTSNPQPWDQTDKSTGAGENGAAGGEVTANGVGPPLSVGRQSFKSARSALTFKTARSRSRTRTASCRTVDDDLEGDMYSVANSTVDCRSVVEEADQECVSVASSSTFKSDGADMHSVMDETDGTTTPGKQPGQKFGSMLVNGSTTDRTSAWLSSHHDLVLEADGTHASPTRADAHAMNAIYGLLW